MVDSSWIYLKIIAAKPTLKSFFDPKAAESRHRSYLLVFLVFPAMKSSETVTTKVYWRSRARYQGIIH